MIPVADDGDDGAEHLALPAPTQDLPAGTLLKLQNPNTSDRATIFMTGHALLDGGRCLSQVGAQ